MTKVPCETAVWETLPFIRCRLTKCLVEEHRLSQKEAAEKLGVSPAAVSQYIKGKRGRGEGAKVSIEIQKHIRQSAEEIMKGGDVATEICKICRMIQREKGGPVPG